MNNLNMLLPCLREKMPGREIDNVNVTIGVDGGSVTATLSLDVEAGGYGAVLVTSSGVDQDLQVQ